MSIIIHFGPAHSGTAPSVNSQTAGSMTMGPGLESDSNLPVVPPDDSSMVDISTSNLHVYSGKEDIEISIPHPTVGSCFGLPYQDHNYGAPPPPTPPCRSPRLSPIHMCPIVETETVSIVTTTLESGEGNESSVTRCVCGYEHDDEYMICCDSCLVWQHVDCMGLDRNNMPDTYLCEQCEPRKVDRHKAKLLQAKKKVALTEKKLIFTETSEDSENESLNRNTESLSKSRSKSAKRKSTSDKESKSEQASPRKGRSQSKNVKERMEIKRSKFRKRNKSRSNSTCSTADEEAQDAWKCSVEWPKRKLFILENIYSDEVRHIASMLKSQCEDQKFSKQLQTQLCKLYESENQKQLVASSDLMPGQQIVEWKGRFLSSSEFRLTHPLFKQRLFPYVLFHKLNSGEEFCVDATDYEVDAKFIKRSCMPNAEVKHIVFNGALHLYVVSTTDIKKDEAITIPFDVDFKDSAQEVVCACNTENCPVLAHKKNGDIDTSEKRRRRYTHSTDDDSNHSTNTLSSPLKTSKGSPVLQSDLSLEQTELRNMSEEQENDEHKEHKRKMTREERKLDAIMRAFDKMEKAAKRRQQALDRLAQHKSQGQQKSDESSEKPEDDITPTKSDDKGISAPAGDTPSVDEKPASTHASAKNKKGKKRRGSGTPSRRRTRTNSGGSDVFNLDETSTSEVNMQGLSSTLSIETLEVVTSEQATSSPASMLSSPVLPKTKRFLHHEWMQEKIETSVPSYARSIHTEMSWSVLAATPTCYVRCTKDSPSTGGISAAHLRRSSMAGNQSKPASGQGSAKKRWLRQAMNDNEPFEVDSSAIVDALNEEISSPVHSTCYSVSHADIGSPSVSVQEDVTPLKKRRIMRNSLESSSSSTEWTTASPDHSSSEPAIDTLFDATHIVENFKIELSSEEGSAEKYAPTGNGLNKHLLKSLRENWIKNENKTRINFSGENDCQLSEECAKVSVSDYSFAEKPEVKTEIKGSVKEANSIAEKPEMKTEIKDFVEEANSIAEKPEMKTEIKGSVVEANSIAEKLEMKTEINGFSEEAIPTEKSSEIPKNSGTQKSHSKLIGELPLAVPIVARKCNSVFTDNLIENIENKMSLEEESISILQADGDSCIAINSVTGVGDPVNPEDPIVNIVYLSNVTEEKENSKIVNNTKPLTSIVESTQELVKAESFSDNVFSDSDKVMNSTMHAVFTESDVNANADCIITVTSICHTQIMDISRIDTVHDSFVTIDNTSANTPSFPISNSSSSVSPYNSLSSQTVPVSCNAVLQNTTTAISENTDNMNTTTAISSITDDKNTTTAISGITDNRNTTAAITVNTDKRKSTASVTANANTSVTIIENKDCSENATAGITENADCTKNSTTVIAENACSKNTTASITENACSKNTTASITENADHKKSSAAISETACDKNTVAIVIETTDENITPAITVSENIDDKSMATVINENTNNKMAADVSQNTDNENVAIVISQNTDNDNVATVIGQSKCNNKTATDQKNADKKTSAAVSENTDKNTTATVSENTDMNATAAFSESTEENATAAVSESTEEKTTVSENADNKTSAISKGADKKNTTTAISEKTNNENTSSAMSKNIDNKSVSDVISKNTNNKSVTTVVSENTDNKITVVTCKRKVSLSEYRQRKRDNHSTNAPLKVEKKKNSILKTIEDTETFLEKQVKLAALPLFQKKITRLPASSLASVDKAFKTKDKNTALEVKKKLLPPPPRENLTERLKREFGLDDISDSQEEKRKKEAECKSKQFLTKASQDIAPILSLCTHLPPPPPPPPPPLPAGSNSSSPFVFSPQLYAQQSSFLMSRISASHYMTGQKPLNSMPIMPMMHSMGAPNVATQPGCAYSAAVQATMSRPTQLPLSSTSNQRFQQPGTHPLYHSPFKSRAYK